VWQVSGAWGSASRRLPGTKGGAFPAFEALVKAQGRSGLPRDVSVALCRAAA